MADFIRHTSCEKCDSNDVTTVRDCPGMGDDLACEKCGAVALDTGLECDECGHDNWQAVTGIQRVWEIS